MTVSWPAVLKPSRWTAPELRGASISGGRTTSGAEQRVYSDAGVWEVSYTVPVRNRSQALAWRSMTARLRAGEDLLLTICDRWRPTAAIAGTYLATVSIAASARATTVSLATTDIDVEEGLHFSLGGDRLYRIIGVGAQSAEDIGLVVAVSGPEDWDDDDIWVDSALTTSEVSILPPLRTAVSAGATADFRDLALRCVIADVSAGDLDLDLGKFADVSIAFREN